MHDDPDALHSSALFLETGRAQAAHLFSRIVLGHFSPIYLLALCHSRSV